MSTEPTHFLTLMNNGKAFSSLDGMACSNQCSDQFQFLPGLWQAKRYWISWDPKKPNLFKNNLNNTRNNLKSQIQNKKNGGIGELLITLNKIIRNQGTYFVLIMYNRLKIISVLGALLYSMGGIFPKQSFWWEEKTFFGQKNYGEVVLNRRTNEQIMPRFGRSFINDKYIFQ